MSMSDARCSFERWHNIRPRHKKYDFLPFATGSSLRNINLSALHVSLLKYHDSVSVCPCPASSSLHHYTWHPCPLKCSSASGACLHSTIHPYDAKIVICIAALPTISHISFDAVHRLQFDIRRHFCCCQHIFFASLSESLPFVAFVVAYGRFNSNAVVCYHCHAHTHTNTNSQRLVVTREQTNYGKTFCRSHDTRAQQIPMNHVATASFSQSARLLHWLDAPHTYTWCIFYR